MKDIEIGANANGTPIVITPEMRKRTHMHVIGGSGTGKSKFLEWMMRKDLREGHGFCLIDWHGTLYNDILRYMAHLDAGIDDHRSIVLVNPSRPDFVTGFNPFMNPGDDVSTQVSKRIDATIKPWGANNTNEMPTFARIARVLYTFMAESGQTLPNAAILLDFDQRQLREYARSQVKDRWVQSQWRSLQLIKTEKDWRGEVLSTDNRLARFVGSTSIKRFMGMTENNIDLVDIMDSNKILLVNLGSSGYLDREAARVFASLFLSEFFEAAMMRANRALTGKKPNHFLLYLDEFQQYITEDIAAMLDEVRKGGLHAILAHQHLGHLVENPKLRKSIFTNARLRAVFGGLEYEDACAIGNEMFLPDLNARQIKKAFYHTIHVYEEQSRLHKSTSRSVTNSTNRQTSRSVGQTWGTSETEGDSDGYTSGSGTGHSAGSGRSTGESSGGMLPMSIGDTEGWFAESSGENELEANSHSSSTSRSAQRSRGAGRSFGDSESESEGFGTGRSRSRSTGITEVPVFVPIPKQELTTEAEWTREEKLSQVAQLLKEQMQQHCFIKLDTVKTQPLMVPFVQERCLSQESLLEYERRIYEIQGAIPADQVDEILRDRQAAFLALATSGDDAEPVETNTNETGRTAASHETVWDNTGAKQSAPESGGSSSSSSSRKSAIGKPGPKPDLENHAKVVKIVGNFGEAWVTDESLLEICEALDAEKVPVPKTWPTRSDGRAHTWLRALQSNRTLVVKAIKDRLKMAQSHNP